jgi:hypothetical protein
MLVEAGAWSSAEKKQAGNDVGVYAAERVGVGVKRKLEVNDELKLKLRKFKLEDEAELFAEKGRVICVEDFEA